MANSFDYILNRIQQAQEVCGRALLISIGGPGGVGKTTFASELARRVGGKVLALDNYRLPRAARAKGTYGSDPKGNNLPLLQRDLEALKSGESIFPPLYRPDSGEVGEGEAFFPSDVVIVEGEACSFESIYEHFDLSVYIESDWRTQLKSRISRDVEVSKKGPQEVLEIFIKSNLNDHELFCRKGKRNADILIHCEEDYTYNVVE